LPGAGSIRNEIATPRRSGADDLLRIVHLPDALFATSSRILTGWAELAGAHLDECSRLGRSPRAGAASARPFWARRPWIEYHLPYSNCTRRVGDSVNPRDSVRKGILGGPQTFPVVAKHAFPFLFNQAEFCIVVLPDQCHRWLRNAAVAASATRH